MTTQILPEEWRPVVGFEGFYEVSDAGRVRGLDRDVDRGRLSGTLFTMFVKGRILKNSETADRYHLVRLRNQGVRQAKVQILVLEAFVGPRPDGYECRHLDGCRTNNRLENLRWGTRSENQRDRNLHGTGPGRKLSWLDVRFIRHWVASGFRRVDVASVFGVETSYVTRIFNRKIRVLG